ncbi:MAG TPA: ABC transporter permease subunit [Egibacteraceae bacterium]
MRAAAITGWVLRERRRSLTLWALALMAVCAMYLAFYPSMANQDMEAIIAGLPEGLVEAMGWDAIATGAGYLESTVYALLGPALLLVFGIGAGAGLIAGEEEAGTLELETAAPVGRRSLLLQRHLALALGLLLLCTALAAMALVLAPALDMGIAASGIVAASVGLYLLVLAMATIAFAVGAASGRRATALGVAAAVTVLAYIADALAPMVEGAAWLETISPFAWYLGGEPLTRGVDAGGVLALAALTLVVLAAGMIAFERRDLGV